MFIVIGGMIQVVLVYVCGVNIEMILGVNVINSRLIIVIKIKVL